MANVYVDFPNWISDLFIAHPEVRPLEINPSSTSLEGAEDGFQRWYLIYTFNGDMGQLPDHRLSFTLHLETCETVFKIVGYKDLGPS